MEVAEHAREWVASEDRPYEEVVDIGSGVERRGGVEIASKEKCTS